MRKREEEIGRHLSESAFADTAEKNEVEEINIAVKVYRLHNEADV